MIKYEGKNRLGETGCNSKHQMDLLILNTPRGSTELRQTSGCGHMHMNGCSMFLLKFWCDLWLKKKNRILGSCGSKRACKAYSFTTARHQRRSPSDEWSLLLPKENLFSGSSRGNCCVMFYIVWECFLLFLEIFCLWTEDEKLYFALKMFQQ